MVNAVLLGQDNADDRTCSDVEGKKFVRQNNTPLISSNTEKIRQFVKMT